MARLTARGLLVATAFALVIGASAQTTPPVAPIRVPPTRPAAPALWPTARIRNLDYVSLRDVATRFSLKPVWSKGETDMALKDAQGIRFSFESNQLDFYFDGLRVFMGHPVVSEKGTLWVSKIDLIKLVAPLIRPVDHLSALPVNPPRLIVIDPGHGGSDPGKENRTVAINEKTMTLDVARRLKKILETGGWQVILTRSEDRELSPNKKKDLQLRDDLANDKKADLFLSIHFNSVEKESERVTGIETYTMTPQFMFSATESKKDDMTDVTFPGNRLDYANLLFGEHLHRAMVSGMKTPDRGFKRGRLAVLRFIECPAALVECAYLSSNAEARKVATPEYRQQIAESLANGVQGYTAMLAGLRAPPPPPVAAVPTAAVVPTR